MAKDLTVANKPAKKAPPKKLASIVKKAKNTAPIVPIRQKLSPLPRPGARSKVLIVPPEQVVASGVAVAQLICHNSLDRKSELYNFKTSIDYTYIFNFIRIGCVVI